MRSKNKVLLIVGLIIVGIIGSVAIGLFTFDFLKKTVINEQKKDIGNIVENNSPQINIEDIIEIGEPAPNFTLEDLEGNKVSLKDYEGKKVVYLNFWASWCPPCRQEMPDLNKLYEENKDDEFIVLAVNVGESEKTVKKFIEENGYTFPVLLDITQEVGITYNTFSIPTSIMIDKEGKIRTYRPGFMTYEQMKEMLDSVK